MFGCIRRIPAGAALLLAFSIAGAETPLPSKTYDVPVRQWLEDYGNYCEAHKLAPEVTFRSPSIWLFSPDGAMTALITVSDDPDLAKLKAAFPPAGAKPLDGKPSLAQARELLSKTLGKDFAPKPVEGQWYAALFLSSSPSCEHCAIFDKGLAELETRAPDTLKVVRVRAVF
jgi:hypothetical protein